MGMCMSSTYADMDAVGAAGKYGLGSDLDSAVLAATNFNSGHQLRVSLSFKCRDLPNMDFMSASDPILILYKRHGNLWNRLGVTEVIHDTLNPDYVTKLTVDYNFECQDLFKIEMYDIDLDEADEDGFYDWTEQEYMGWCEFYIHEVVSNPDQTMIKKFSLPNHPKSKAHIQITAEEKSTNDNTEICILTPAAIIFKSGKDTYFFMIFKEHKNKSWIPVYKSEMKPSISHSVKWNKILVGTSDMCDENPEQPIKLEVYKASSKGAHEFIQSFLFTLAHLQHGDHSEFEMPKFRFYFQDIMRQKTSTFLEYVFGGVEIGLAIGIDFTLSNGDPKNPNSLHNLDPTKNEFLQVIKSVGSILQYYNTSKLIHLFGFGCGVPPYTTTQSSCCALNGNIFDPRVDGLKEVIECYKHTLKNVALYGPTYFADILSTMNGICEMEPGDENNQKFQVIMYITDGAISDFQKTIDQIVRGSRLPVTIIIVGVGKNKFEEMEVLDGDHYPLFSEEYQSHCDADIVQFVQYEQFKDQPFMLAKEVLKEFPTQMLNYMRKRDILPLKKSEQERRERQEYYSMNQFSKFTEVYKTDKRPPVALYLQQQKEKFFKEVEEAGLDMVKVRKFINTHGLYEFRLQILIDHLDNEKYINPLKRNYGADVQEEIIPEPVEIEVKKSSPTKKKMQNSGYSEMNEAVTKGRNSPRNDRVTLKDPNDEWNLGEMKQKIGQIQVDSK